MGRLSNEAKLERAILEVRDELSELRAIIEFHFAYKEVMSDKEREQILEENPSFGLFLDETTDEDWTRYRISAVYGLYVNLCEQNNLKPVAINHFSRFMKANGWETRVRREDGKTIRVMFRVKKYEKK